MSREILHDVLREELGFSGIVVTDALEMKAISAAVGRGGGSCARDRRRGRRAVPRSRPLRRVVVAVRHALVEAVARDVSPRSVSPRRRHMSRLATWATARAYEPHPSIARAGLVLRERALRMRRRDAARAARVRGRARARGGHGCRATVAAAGRVVPRRVPDTELRRFDASLSTRTSTSMAVSSSSSPATRTDTHGSVTRSKR